MDKEVTVLSELSIFLPKSGFNSVEISTKL